MNVSYIYIHLKQGKNITNNFVEQQPEVENREGVIQILKKKVKSIIFILYIHVSCQNAVMFLKKLVDYNGLSRLMI